MLVKKMTMLNKVQYILLGIFLLLNIDSSAQRQEIKNLNPLEIEDQLKYIYSNKRVLYIAAHPDDENTRLISYFAKGLNSQVAYLSLTRGDGGQNLIGNELGVGLGIIRTQELMEARRKDGGIQFFTRAYDFGYSKSADETFKMWNKQKILHDVVYTIRYFKPDIIITRFPEDSRAGHGHHSASAILAREAFFLAGDKTAFPEQLKELDIHQSYRLFFNASIFFQPDLEKYYQESGIGEKKLARLDIGNYLINYGKSIPEIAAESRSKHRSQGFGSARKRGETIEYLQLVEGPDLENNSTFYINPENLFSPKKITPNQNAYSIYKKKGFNSPEFINSIFDLYNSNLSANYWVKKSVEKILFSSLGLFLEALSDKEYCSNGDSLNINFTSIVRNPVPVKIKFIKLDGVEYFSDIKLEENKEVLYSKKIKIEDNQSQDIPYWVKKPIQNNLFQFEENRLLSIADHKSELNATFVIQYENKLAEINVPVNYKYTEPSEGEIYQPFYIIPKTIINCTKENIIYTKAGTYYPKIKYLGKIDKDLLKIETKGGKEIPFNLIKEKGDQYIQLEFLIPQGEKDQSWELKFTNKDGISFYDFEIIDYPHIKKQYWYKEAVLKISYLNSPELSHKMAYIEGAGDDVFEITKKLGVDIEIIKSSDLSNINLNIYKTIIVGIRGFNTDKILRENKKYLFDYVKQGGNLVVQYQTSQQTDSLFCSPIGLQLGRERVTEENSDISVLDKNSAVLNYPFKIEKDDFLNWTQERGLYFGNNWNSQFKTVIGINDSGESLKTGSILVLEYGKGRYIYTGISFFRQLPDGNVGAMKLWYNLIHRNEE